MTIDLVMALAALAAVAGYYSGRKVQRVAAHRERTREQEGTP